MNPFPSTVSVCVLLFGITWSSISLAQSVSLRDGPKTLRAGEEYVLSLESNQNSAGIIQAQLMDPNWKKVAEKWTNIEKGNQETQLKIKIPSDATNGKGFFWQILLYDKSWSKKAEKIVKGVEINNASVAPSTPKPNAQKMKDDKASSEFEFDSDWTPDGQWKIDWQDEFDGTGLPENWYPFLGYTPEDFANKTEKGIRWNGKDEDSSQMYSAKKGQHWLNGKGQLLLQISTDKTKSNANGARVNAAYLMTGFPEKWQKSEPTNVKWAGKFFSPAKAPRYICARIKTDQLQGHSTWLSLIHISEPTRPY